jgi:hypothetical protein
LQKIAGEALKKSSAAFAGPPIKSCSTHFLLSFIHESSADVPLRDDSARNITDLQLKSATAGQFQLNLSLPLHLSANYVALRSEPMNLKTKLQRILPLSAASVALLQSTFPSKGDVPDSASTSKHQENPNGQVTSHTDHLILAPAHQDELLKMYAGHTSHASHASHYSGTGGGYTAPSSDPAPSYPTYPAQTPAAPSYVQPRPKSIASASHAPATNSVIQTNSITLTNTTPQVSAEADAANVELLKKQAAAGSSDAQLTLSLYYYYGGHGLTKSEEKAEMLLEMSALQGNFGAQNLKKQREEKQKLEKDDASSGGSKQSPTP